MVVGGPCECVCCGSGLHESWDAKRQVGDETKQLVGPQRQASSAEVEARLGKARHKVRRLELEGKVVRDLMHGKLCCTS